MGVRKRHASTDNGGDIVDNLCRARERMQRIMRPGQSAWRIRLAVYSPFGLQDLERVKNHLMIRTCTQRRQLAIARQFVLGAGDFGVVYASAGSSTVVKRITFDSDAVSELIVARKMGMIGVGPIVRDAYVDGKYMYIVSDRIKNGRPLSKCLPGHADLRAAALATLAKMNAAGWRHGDAEPRNFVVQSFTNKDHGIISTTYVVWLVDFGLSTPCPWTYREPLLFRDWLHDPHKVVRFKRRPLLRFDWRPDLRLPSCPTSLPSPYHIGQGL